MKTDHVAEPITPERFVALTKHLRINGKPIENLLWQMKQDRERLDRELGLS